MALADANPTSWATLSMLASVVFQHTSGSIESGMGQPCVRGDVEMTTERSLECAPVDRSQRHDVPDFSNRTDLRDDRVEEWAEPIVVERGQMRGTLSLVPGSVRGR